MPFYDLTCKNGHEQYNLFLKIGERPPCPNCSEPTETLWVGKSNSVISDEIPGGIWIRHGICNEDGTPKKYYSKSEMEKEAKRRGMTNKVEHVGTKDSDKSRHTTRWF
jgi:hypothetical protein